MELSLRQLAEDEKERLRRNLSMCLEAVEVPRRLGPDASDAELAADKKTARQIAHRVRAVLAMWGGNPNDLPDVEGAGARMSWAEWYQEQLAYLTKQIELVNSSTIKSGDSRRKNSIIHRFTWESDQLTSILGEV